MRRGDITLAHLHEVGEGKLGKGEGEKGGKRWICGSCRVGRNSHTIPHTSPHCITPPALAGKDLEARDGSLAQRPPGPERHSAAHPDGGLA